MAQLWKIDEYGNEELLEETHHSHQAREAGERLAASGYSHKLVVIVGKLDTVVWEYVPDSWK